MATIGLIDADPDLGQYLTDARLAAARRELVAEIGQTSRGSARLDERAPGGVSGVGLLLLDGLVERDVAIADTISAELLGPGDVIRNRNYEQAPSLLGATIRWDVLADTRFAVLDDRFGQLLLRYPEVHAAMLDRMIDRIHRLSTAQAISQLNGIDRRLLALFWHLGERWGRVSTDGLVVPLDLPHRVLAQLVGARRQTVSTAIGRLAERGELRRRDDGAWIVDRASALSWAPDAVRPVAPRRLRLLEPVDGDGAAAHDRLRPDMVAAQNRAREGG
jgi:CRP/FNR family transcriptional regulator, cyclic AMP receptor protein